MTTSFEREDNLSWAMDVPAPTDADGKVVPLDVRELYTDAGKLVTVEEITFNGCWWYVKCFETDCHRLMRFHLEWDSWERLLKDLERPAESGDRFCSVACAYVDKSGNTCGDCKLRESCGACSRGMLEDIASRIRKLRGDAE